MDFFSLYEAKGIDWKTYLGRDAYGKPLLIYESDGIEKARAQARKIVCGRSDALMDLVLYLYAKYDLLPGGFRLKQRFYLHKRSPQWKGGALFFTEPLPNGMRLSGNYVEISPGLARSFLIVREGKKSGWRIWDSTGIDMVRATAKKYRNKLNETDVI